MTGLHQPVRLAQIGVGYWGMNLLRNFAELPDVEMPLICDTNADALSRATEAFPGLQATASPTSIWNDDTIEGVVIATETPQHYALAKEALLAGKHVFVEKPLAQTASEAEELVRLAEERDLRLMVGHLLLYHPAFHHVRGLIDSGDLGDIRYLYSTRVNLGIVRQKENAFDSLAPHDLSIALAFLDSRPVSIAAHGQSYLQPRIEDVVFANVFFEDDALAHIHASWLDPHKVRKTTIVGSQKMAVIDDMEPAEKVRVFDKGAEVQASASGYADFATSVSVRSGDIVVPKIKMTEPLRIECQEFARSIQENREPLTSGQSGLAVVRLLEAARQSIRNNGTPIDL